MIDKDFLEFRKMVTPIIIQIVFWIGVVASVVFGVVLIVIGVGERYGGGPLVLVGLLMLLLGPIFTRIGCEVLILLFRMNETLTEIKSSLERRP